VPRPGAGAALAVGFDGTRIPDDVVALAGSGGLGGVVLFARNCPDLETVLGLTAAARRLDRDTLVLGDHEGGRVHRLPAPFTRFPAAATIGRVADPALAARVARAMARELRAAGFDSGLTPVVDCLTEPRCSVIGDRAFGTDPAIVAACGVAFVEGLLAGGIIPVAKHFPGHGRTPLDSHVELPVVDAPLEALEAVELMPFRRALAAGCPAVMVGHVRYPALDPERPASLSASVIEDLLRRRLGFAGLVMTDDLDMAAVAGAAGRGDVALQAIEAGADLALVCRSARARAEAVAAIGAAQTAGRVSLEASGARRAALRRMVEAAGPSPDLSVVGCLEHREIAEEVLRRAGSDRDTSS
jgi:beta-N-acetylhexosaminidase